MDHEVAKLTKEHFERDGFVVARNCIRDIALYADAWNAYYAERFAKGRTPDWNPVNVEGPFPSPLDQLPRHAALLDLAAAIWGPDLALYNYRFVVKDRYASEAVFLHQDFPYHFGWPSKASFFIALSEVMPNNGAMRFVSGSHKYGYLSDAGQLSGLGLTAHTYALEPGDVVAMHSCIWHESMPRVGGPDRVMADIIIQPANDPSGVELLAGEWRTDLRLTKDMRERLFVRSRVSRIKQLEAAK